MSLSEIPKAIDHERLIIGAILLDERILDKVLSIIRIEDFWKEAHRVILKTLYELSEDGQVPDIVNLGQRLKHNRALEAIGGTEYLAELLGNAVTSANVAHYCEVVKEKAIRRRLLAASNQVALAAREELEPLKDCLDKAERSVLEVRERSTHVSADVAPVRSVISETIRAMETLTQRHDSVTGVPSGFEDLDRLTAGFQPSDLIIVAGRPSMGKTSLGICFMLGAALENNVPTAFFSLEMSRAQIGMRVLAARSRVSLQSVRTGWLSERDWRKIMDVAGTVSDTPLYIHDGARLTPMELRAVARRLKREKGLGLVVVDYLQLMVSGSRRDSREQEIAEISRSLKALAKERNIPVIALSQLNRKVEERQNKRPQLSDLRESGAIEQDADMVMFIYRESVYQRQSEQDPRRGEAEIIIAKQRNGPTGTVKAYFDSRFSMFYPMVRKENESTDYPQLDVI